MLSRGAHCCMALYYDVNFRRGKYIVLSRGARFCKALYSNVNCRRGKYSAI